MRCYWIEYKGKQKNFESKTNEIKESEKKLCIWADNICFVSTSDFMGE